MALDKMVSVPNGMEKMEPGLMKKIIDSVDAGVMINHEFSGSGINAEIVRSRTFGLRSGSNANVRTTWHAEALA